MANYDLSSPRAIAVAAEVAVGKAGNEPNQGSYNAAWLHGYASALKDVAEQLQKAMTMQVGKVESSEVEYVRDFGNGYKIQVVFANQLSDGAYGDIYDLRQDVLLEHPHDGILIGYCVVDTVDGVVPLGCNDWNNTVAEAIADYTDNVVPYLEVRDIEVHSWKEMQEKYPMGREEMSEEEEEAFVADCFKLYEQEGFSPRYWSPFSDNQERVGLPVEIVGRVNEDEAHDLECLPMWKARLDGCEFEVFPEEVVPSEMKANGCRWFEDVLEYDRCISERVVGLPVDVMSPQEMSDATGKAVKDGNKYYLPMDIVPGVDNIVRDAEVSMGEIFDKVMACGIDDSAEYRLYMEQALEVFLGQKFDVYGFMEEVWSLIDLSPEEERNILEAVYSFEGEQVYSVDTRLVKMVQAARERAAKAVEREKNAGVVKGDEIEIG